MKLENVALAALKPHPQNPRIHPDSAIEKLMRSIGEFGWTNPVLVSADGYVLAGHARLKAAQRLGLAEVPAIRLDLSGAKALAYMVADNRLQDETAWDVVALQDLFKDLRIGEIDVTLTGFDPVEVERLLAQADVPAGEPELDGSLADGVERVTCPKCGHVFPV